MSNYYSHGICKLFYINDLHVKRQKSDVVDSARQRNDKELTYLNSINTLYDTKMLSQTSFL